MRSISMNLTGRHVPNKTATVCLFGAIIAIYELRSVSISNKINQ